MAPHTLLVHLSSQDPSFWAQCVAPPYAHQQARLLYDFVHEALITYRKGGRVYVRHPGDSGALRALLAAGHLVPDTFDTKPILVFDESFLERAAQAITTLC